MKPTSLLAVVISCLIMFVAFFFYRPWERGVLDGADSSGYYAYLPAVFIHRDILTLDKCNEARRMYSSRGSASTAKLSNGHHLNQYTCGVALLELPAFFVAHIFALLSDYPPDGYSFPYSFMVVLAGLLYVFFGLYFLRLFLLNYFSENVVAVALLIVGLGTNLYYIGVLKGGMAHAHLFFLTAVFLWLSQKWKSTSQAKQFYGLALLLGFITLVRPNMLVLGLLLPFMVGRSFFQLFKRPLRLLIGVVLFILPFVPQFYYWKMITGDYIVYSYGNQGFDFLNPHIIEGLLGFKNGWLIYTPIMFFALLGLILGMKKGDNPALGIFFVLDIHIYVIYSWWCWNYINGFGSRPMVEMYPLLAYPLALFIRDFFRFRKVFYGVSSLLILLNIFQTHQTYGKVLWPEGATRAYYCAIFGKTQLDYEALVALDCDITQPEHLVYKKTIAVEGFESPNISKRDSTHSFSGSSSFCIYPGLKYSPKVKTTIVNTEKHKSDWLRISAVCMSLGYASFYENSHLVVSISRKGKQILWKSIRINNKIRDTYYSVHNGEINRWKEIFFFVPLSDLFLESTDEVVVYGWHNGYVPVCLDDMKLEIWGEQ